MNQVLMDRTKDPIEKAKLKQEILKDEYKDEYLVRKWQKRQRELIASNPNLNREYRRESISKMAQDLGVKLHLRKDKDLKKHEKNDIIEERPKGLINTKKGEVVKTKIGELVPQSLKNYNEKTGWNVDWSSMGSNVKIYGIVVEGDKRLQGLMGIRHDKNKKSTYLHWISTAPHNNKLLNNGKQEYKGVGSYLVAKAAEESVKAGFGGHIHGCANTRKTLEYYQKAWGAKSIPTLHQYQFEIDEKAAQELIKKYGLGGKKKNEKK